MEKEPTYELGCHGDGCCVRDCILAEDHLYVWLCSGVWGAGGKRVPPQPHTLGLESGDGDQTGRTGLALQVFGWPFLEHSNESLYPRGLANPDVMRWGWGLSPASGLAASDKKPWEEFTAPFNTVIIFFCLQRVGAAPAWNGSIASFRKMPGRASSQDNFLGKH